MATPGGGDEVHWDHDRESGILIVEPGVCPNTGTRSIFGKDPDERRVMENRRDSRENSDKSARKVSL